MLFILFEASMTVVNITKPRTILEDQRPVVAAVSTTTTITKSANTGLIGEPIAQPKICL